MASGHPSSCATATLGSVCHCECGGVRHSWAGGDMPSGVKAPKNALASLDATKTPNLQAPDGLGADDLTPSAPNFGGANPGGTVEPADDSSGPPASTDPGPAATSDLADLIDLVNSPVTSRQSLAPGRVGVVERISHEGGDEFHKVNNDYGSRSGEESTDAEELAALVGRALGANVPRVHRVGPNEIHTDWTNGVTGLEHAETHGDESWLGLINSDDGRLLGLLDLITHNGDRHDGNWIVGEDGRPVGIDHGLAWGLDILNPPSDPEAYLRRVNDGGMSPFNNYFGRRNRANPLEFSSISPDDVSEIRDRLEALRPEFDRLGRGAWLDQSLRVADALEPFATATESMLRGDRPTPPDATDGPEPVNTPDLVTTPPVRSDPEASSVGAERGTLEDLVELVNSPVTGRQSLTPGKVGVVERVSHEGGDEFHKVNGDFGRRWPAETSTDAEELAALVGEALGVDLPHVHRAGPAEIHTDWTNGVTAAEYRLDHQDELDALANSDAGRRIALFDLIINNSDRHDGNYMVTDDGRIIAIDNGLAWRGLDRRHLTSENTDDEVLRFATSYVGLSQSPLLRDFEDWGSDIGFISRAEVIDMRIRLEELRPTFHALGRDNWLDHSLRVLDALAPRVSGTRS